MNLHAVGKYDDTVNACRQDLRDAMVSSGIWTQAQSGQRWRYLQILVVVQSEVEEYKIRGPATAVIFALPEGAEKMGIGCSRYFTKKLAETICPKKFQFCLMMDDSVQYWRGITLPNDPIKLFGEDPQDSPVRY
jgi:hypothetical protein